MAMVALVDFLDPRLQEHLDIYRSLPNVTAVREHLGWDRTNPLRRFAKRPDFLTDPTWQKALERLREHDFKCGLEVFAHQLPTFCRLSDVFQKSVIAVVGWPLDLSSAGFDQWRRDLSNLSQCKNVCADISVIECVFGMDWRLEQISPWVLSMVELFGPARCMFGSHLPIATLSFGFDRLYAAYQQIVADFSVEEKDQIFRQVAADWFAIKMRPV